MGTPSDPIQIFYVNGGNQAVQLYVWDGSKPILWDGAVSFTGSITIGNITGTLTNNNAAPSNNNIGALTAVASSTAASYTEGRQVLLQTDLTGALKVNATFTTTGLATSANQTNASQKAQVVDGSGNVIGSTSNALDVNIKSTGTTQPVSGTVTAVNSKTIKVAVFNTSSVTDVVTAVTSKRIKVIAVKVMTVSTTSITGGFYSDGTTGTQIDAFLLQATTGISTGFVEDCDAPSFLFATDAGKKLTLQPNSQVVVGRVTYFDDDAS